VKDIQNEQVIRDGSLTLVTLENGDIPIEENHGYGLYYRDCRFLSGYVLKVNDLSPIRILSSDEKGYSSLTMLTNPRFEDESSRAVEKQTISIRRERAIPGAVYENIAIQNFNEFDVTLRLTLDIYSDFDDIFTVRGVTAKTPGEISPPAYDGKFFTISCHAKDGHTRNTRFAFKPEPSGVDGDTVTFTIHMGPHQVFNVNIWVYVEDIPPDRPAVPSLSTIEKRIKGIKASYADTMECCSNVQTDNGIFNKVFLRSLSDLRMLYMGMPVDIFYSAGVPWYDALFGRDSIISSMQVIPYNPQIAKSTLKLLASFQGRKVDNWRDEEPGKILHELRVGEKANLNEIPQTPYYGSVDATPLFLILLAEFIDWTGDLSLLKDLMKNVDAAIEWIDRYSDLDSSGFASYMTRSSRGIYNQGWKDSGDSISHSDGSLAVAPVALAEVQGYVYMAKKRIASLFDRMDRKDDADRLRKEAMNLRWNFNERFWMKDKKYFAQALDKNGVCDVISSNPAQALWSEIVAPDKAGAVVSRIFERDMFSGWGVRTLSTIEKRHNPLGYHNGTVWPHDNSLIAMGLCKYGFKEELLALFTSMYEAAAVYPRYRLPELFGGFQREEYDIPIKYPVACSPQAWSAGSIPYMLTSSLGLFPDALNERLTLVKPSLPPWLHRVKISKLIVGKAYTHLEFQRVGESTLVNVVGKRGNLEVQVVY
jgi:glycogen debranching enzyme